MSFYEERILPHLINLAMRNRQLVPYRERVIGAAEGRVLEIGIGSGRNLPFYGSQVREVVGIEPSARLREMAEQVEHKSSTNVSLVRASAENIPLDDKSFDTVVTTWTLCSIPDAHRALGEMRRVLKPSGQLLFVEHGLAPDIAVRKWQDRLTPIWKRIGGGCHLNRPITTVIASSGFRIDQIATGYMPGPKPMTYMYQGRARP
jgi:ubiquinone/menaquinone biosynthesis C-methylase UbiE